MNYIFKKKKILFFYFLIFKIPSCYIDSRLVKRNSFLILDRFKIFFYVYIRVVPILLLILLSSNIIVEKTIVKLIII
jgi:hypothetical protein